MKDGKLNKEGFMEHASKMTAGDAEKLKLAEEVFDECNSSEDGDECEAASKIAVCMKDNSAKKKVMLGI